MVASPGERSRRGGGTKTIVQRFVGFFDLGKHEPDDMPNIRNYNDLNPLPSQLSKRRQGLTKPLRTRCGDKSRHFKFENELLCFQCCYEMGVPELRCLSVGEAAPSHYLVRRELQSRSWTNLSRMR